MGLHAPSRNLLNCNLGSSALRRFVSCCRGRYAMTCLDLFSHSELPLALSEMHEVLCSKWAGQNADTLCLGQLIAFIWQGKLQLQPCDALPVPAGSLRAWPLSRRMAGQY
ncbi:hypothetical protein CVIRNUC_000300 [Coccomyxa viridis]|uniref:Uncharacterized protein n=1 Tax=Coccomyxa viridis TaxID=1274662 RepID=A0AAV1HPU4_9CHLO|nr:hypothetical protein CVIRNUC_000300 [Coccomyxa viridis]